MRELIIESTRISVDDDRHVIAEIGHNHQERVAEALLVT